MDYVAASAMLSLIWTETVGCWPGTFGRGPLCFGRGPHDMDMAGDLAIWHMDGDRVFLMIRQLV